MTSGPVPNSSFKEYAAAGALLTGVIAWFPLAASWFYAVGFTYYDTLMERVGLNASTLDIPDRQVVAKGYELVRDATYNWVAALVLALPFLLLFGALIAWGGVFIDKRREAAGDLAITEKTWAKITISVGRFVYFASTLLALVLTLWLAGWASPTVGRDAGQLRVTCAKNGEGKDCPALLDYGGYSDAARLLVADRNKAYVYQFGSLRIIKLDGLSEISSTRRRPKVDDSIGDAARLAKKAPTTSH
jgi:hypothetical protein